MSPLDTFLPLLKVPKVLQLQLLQMSFKYKKKKFSMLICPLLIFKYITNFFFHSPWFFLFLRPLHSLIYSYIPPSHLLLSTFLFSQPACLSAACNGTHRLRADGDDSQAVPAQAHHRWHQRLRSPH